MSIFQTWKAIQFYKGIKRNAKRIDREQRRRWTDKRFIDEKLAGEITKKWKAVKEEQK